MTTSYRLLTWNIWGDQADPVGRCAAIVSTIAAHRPDLITLQEIPSYGLDAIASELSMHAATSAPAPAVTSDDDRCRVGILSRWPIDEAHTVRLPHEPTDVVRSAIIAHTGPGAGLTVASVHLSWGSHHAKLRRRQIKAVVDAVAGVDRTCVLAGDFNAPANSSEFDALTDFTDAWPTARNDDPGHTWRLDNPHAARETWPSRRIDLIWIRSPAGHHDVVRAELVGTESVDEVWPSDHAGVVVDIRVSSRTTTADAEGIEFCIDRT